MKTLFALVLFTACATAQPDSVGIAATFGTGNQTSGNGRAIGGCVSATHEVLTRLAVAEGQGCWDSGDKNYLGDGSNLKARGELHLYYSRQGTFRPFVIGGLNYSRQKNFAYSKGAMNPYLGAGINWKDRVIAYGQYLLPENETQNNVSAVRVGGYYLKPIARRWTIKAGGEMTAMHFTQPAGTAKGVYWAPSFQGFVGILWMRNEWPAKPVMQSPPIIRPAKADLPMMHQGFVGDYGNWQLVIPTL